MNAANPNGKGDDMSQACLLSAVIFLGLIVVKIRTQLNGDARSGQTVASTMSCIVKGSRDERHA
jgi:hypothetical protein